MQTSEFTVTISISIEQNSTGDGLNIQYIWNEDLLTWQDILV